MILIMSVFDNFVFLSRRIVNTHILEKNRNQFHFHDTHQIVF